MTDDDPFADLGETLDQEPDDRTERDAASADASDGAADGSQTEAHDPATDPAFTYDEAKQRPFYARETTVDDFDSWLNYELEREISDRGYDNVVVREMTDALLRTVVQEDLVDTVAERFEAARDSPASETNE